MIKPLPKGPKEIQELTDQMYARMLKREEDAITKLRQVIEFATNDDCEYSTCIKCISHETQVWHIPFRHILEMISLFQTRCAVIAASARLEQV